MHLKAIIEIYSIQLRSVVFSVLDFRGTYCPAGSLACSSGSSGISLVKLLGAQGTQIFDEMKKCNSVDNYHDRTNVIAALFDNTVYTLHIELYCVESQNNQNFYGQDALLGGSRCSFCSICWCMDRF